MKLTICFLNALVLRLTNRIGGQGERKEGRKGKEGGREREGGSGGEILDIDTYRLYTPIRSG